MEIKFENQKMKVKTEYDRTFINKAKQIGGKWDTPYWVFSEEREEWVRNILLDCFGEDGRIHKTVNVNINLDEYKYDYGSIYLGNILIAERKKSYNPVKLHQNAWVFQGEFDTTGGSVKNPCISAKAGTIVRVENVPIEIWERVKDKKGLSLVKNEESHKKVLMEERESLLKRIKEIDELLKVN